uniref:Uncharacterized protein n=1 Tax=Branchiostoma floridae TaxID=7739 RepID=C3ZGI3_BRAFL|eukprot:XP_002592353.1 hypothetical protein BRAFLDRAFT_101239 [Branchiostoma floridae]
MLIPNLSEDRDARICHSSCLIELDPPKRQYGKTPGLHKWSAKLFQTLTATWEMHNAPKRTISSRCTTLCLPEPSNFRELYPRHSPVPARVLPSSRALPATLAGACPGLTIFVSSTRDTRRCLPGSYHLRELYPRHSPVPARVLPSSRALPATLAGACPGLTIFVSSTRDTRRCLPGSYHLRELYPRHSPVPARVLPSSVQKGEEEGGRTKRDCPAVILAHHLLLRLQSCLPHLKIPEVRNFLQGSLRVGKNVTREPTRPGS